MCLFIHSAADGHLGHFQCLAMTDSAARNILVEVLGWTYLSVEYVGRTRSAGSEGTRGFS